LGIFLTGRSNVRPSALSSKPQIWRKQPWPNKE
jgi:hypothetical protein